MSIIGGSTVDVYISKFYAYIILHAAPDGQYNGIRDVFRELVSCWGNIPAPGIAPRDQQCTGVPFPSPQMRNDGPKALFRGITPILLRAFPANAVSGATYTTCMCSKLRLFLFI